MAGNAVPLGCGPVYAYREVDAFALRLAMKTTLLPFALLVPVSFLCACSDASSSSGWKYGGTGGSTVEFDGGGGATGGAAGAGASSGAAGQGGTGAQDAGTLPEAGPEAAPQDVAPQPWIQITSPEHNETVENPVSILFEGGGGVTHVAIEADDWPLHTDPIAVQQGTLMYEFTGVGFERTLVAIGLDSAGLEVASDQVVFTPVNFLGDLVFPIDLNNPGMTLSHFDSSSSTASFGASRSGGRLHAGCDLYWTDDGGYAYETSYYPYNDDTPIYAVADGTIIAYDGFYMGTNELVIDHGDFVIRYGEVEDSGLPNGLGVGSTVSAGQLIAYMGDLSMSSGTWAMLHFELYSGDLAGPLTDTGNSSYMHVPNGNYQRRGDLMDCTPFLLDIMNQ